MTDPRRQTGTVASLLALVVLLAACRAAGQPTSSATPAVSPSASAAASPASTESPPASSPSASETASASPSASGAEGEFAIAPNADADALFLDRDDCENVADGYRVSFPEAWWTNTAIGDVEPCRWFSPTFYEVADPSETPAEIAITITYTEGDVGSFEATLSREFGIVGGTQPAVRVEYRGAAGEGGTMPPDWRMYRYLVQLGPTEEEGPNLVITTDTDMGGDYELNKAVLDRIVATMELIGTIE